MDTASENCGTNWLEEETNRCLSSLQQFLLSRPLTDKIFLEGAAGTGKTTAAAERLLRLLREGIPAASVLVLVPYRALLEPYAAVLQRAEVAERVPLFTFAALARRMVERYGSVIAAEAGFAYPENPPTFLNLEAAQMVLARTVQPMLAEGFFEGVSLERNRLYTQILDNLNKAAVVGFPLSEVAARLKSAWTGEADAARRYDDAQEAALRFRRDCLAHNLLDFSLQVEVFMHNVWPNPACRADLLYAYRHLIADNLEEGVPAMHDLLAEWIPYADSALLIYDHAAGYRRLLGADPQNALTLQGLCQESLIFEESFVTPPGLQAFGVQLAQRIAPALTPSRPPLPPNLGGSEGGGGEETRPPLSVPPFPPPIAASESLLSRSSFGAAMGGQRGVGRDGEGVELARHRFYPEMLDWTAGKITALMEGGTPPDEIAVLAPFMPDHLCFSLTERLNRRGISAVAQRPSHPLRDEPDIRCLLTLARLAHPAWNEPPSRSQVAQAFEQTIEGMDAVRAQLLSEIVYRRRDNQPVLTSFERVQTEMRGRITPELGERFEQIYRWVSAYRQGEGENLAVFFERLLAEALSQPGCRFHPDFYLPRQLIASTRNWEVLSAQFDNPGGPEFIRWIEAGLLAAQYPQDAQPANAVLLSPAYTFLMNHRMVDYQFWLDIGSADWARRLHQPLTHPYVLSRQWPPGASWGYAEEIHARQDALACLILGLIHRCRRGLFLTHSELDEQGYEQHSGLSRMI